MRPDPGREVLARIGQRLREDGFRLVRDQVDRTGPMDPVAEGMFILDRLYPEMLPAHHESLRRKMQADYERGKWAGFKRPPEPSAG